MNDRASRAVVMGLGAFGGGVGVTRYLVSSGYEVTVTDLRTEAQLRGSLASLAGLPVKLVLGEHRECDFMEVDLVAVNPAVRCDHPLVRQARAGGARITSEIELFLGANRGRVIAVTGTQGKSSTCQILAHLLTPHFESAGQRVHLGGNIGGSLLESVDAIDAADLVVLELSSYQLESLEDPGRAGRRVVAVCLTNLLADHLERHGDLASYRRAKARLLALMPEGASALLPVREAGLWTWDDRSRRCILFSESDESSELGIRDGKFLMRGRPLASVDQLSLPGDFQRANALCALGMASLFGLSPVELGTALASVPGLPHRLQALGKFRGRRVHDNGVSTTPDSTVSALRSFHRADTGVHLILGGRMKKLDLEELLTVAAERVRSATCFGESGELLAGKLRAVGVDAGFVPDLVDAAREALARAEEDSDVLFSPACASFDAFQNFRERALAFRAALPPPDPISP